MAKNEVIEKNSKRSIPFGSFIIVVALTFLVGFVAGTRKDEIFSAVGVVLDPSGANSNLDLSSINDIYRQLASNYNGELDERLLIEGAKRGLVAATGDRYTVYMNREEATEFKGDLEGDVGAGIGVEISTRNERATIIRALDGNPAIEAGIKAGDVITKVNDTDTTTSTSEEVANLVRGEVGTTVKLQVERSGNLLDFAITRAKINNPSVSVNYQNNIAVVRISRFDTETGSLFKKVAKEINEKGIKKIILDLRANGGGYVNTARDVLSQWLDGEIIYTEKTKSGSIDNRSSKGGAILSDTETIVLIDEGTASASEIVAGALKDHGKATLVGAQSYGKGSVQSLIDISSGEILKVTIANWYTPNGKNITDEGISPDETIPLTIEDLNNNNDTQLNHALNILK